MLGERVANTFVSAAPDFCLYGLESWPGNLWVDSVAGEPLSTVRLAHGIGLQGLLVTTLSRARHEAEAAELGLDPFELVALNGADSLFNLTWPTSPAPDLLGLGRVALDHLKKLARSWREWSEVSWTLADDEIQAHFLNFAGGWTGFSSCAQDVHIVVTAVGVGMDAVRLAPAIIERYGIAPGEPITTATLSNPWTFPRPNEFFHPDHTALVSS
jgi:hypothetical protein